MAIQVPLYFDPRDYQAEALAALDLGVTISVWCWARRGGKDFTAFAYAIKKMVQEPMNVVIVWPTMKQGYDNFWNTTENDGKKIFDHIPKGIIASRTNSETNMKIIFKNGSVLSLLGAKDPEALRGANGKLYIFSEFVDISSEAYEVIRPIIAVNGGQIIVQSTPKVDGTSGAAFKKMWERAFRKWTEGDKTQFASRITADHFLSKEILKDLEEEIVEKYGSNFKFMQEYMCDWGQVSETSYYGNALMQLEKRGRIRDVPWRKEWPVYTAWDLGTGDSTAITFFQYVNKQLFIIDYYETHDVAYSTIVAALKLKPYNYGWHFVPHDANVREQSDAIERIQKLEALGLTNISIITREGKEHGIQRAVEEIIKAFMNTETTKQLREKLLKYSRKWNPDTGEYMGPEHKTESHAADSVRYMFAAIRQFFDDAGNFLFEAGGQETYESDSFAAAAQYKPAS
jgi:hypothetical protein